MAVDRRVIVQVSELEYQRGQRLMPWGMTGRIMRLLYGQVLDLVENHGDVVLGALLVGRVTVLDLLKKGLTENGAGGPEEKFKLLQGRGAGGTSEGDQDGQEDAEDVNADN